MTSVSWLKTGFYSLFKMACFFIFGIILLPSFLDMQSGIFFICLVGLPFVVLPYIKNVFVFAMGSYAEAMEDAYNNIIIKSTFYSDGSSTHNISRESDSVLGNILAFIFSLLLALVIYTVIAGFFAVIAVFVVPVAIVGVFVCAIKEHRYWMIIFDIILLVLEVFVLLLIISIFMTTFPDLYTQIDKTTWYGSFLQWLESL